jgi:hypothetical protein
MLDYGIFYEFIPKSEFGKENPKVFALDEVELDKNYAIYIFRIWIRKKSIWM